MSDAKPEVSASDSYRRAYEVDPRPRYSAVVMVTGSRDWDDKSAVFNALWNVAEEWQDQETGYVRIALLHGDCRGADRMAVAAAATIGCFDVKAYPADWKKHGKRAGFIRNQEMIDNRPDLVLAFQRNESKGTADAIGRAKAAGIPVRIVAKVEA